MGLLDDIYSPQTYSGSGGLLDRLLPMLGNFQSAGFPQQQPGSGRSFDNATFDPATYAPSQSSNSIAIGNYQMPRIGDPDQFQPQQAMTPPNAQATQGQMPGGQAQLPGGQAMQPTQGQMQQQQMPPQPPQQTEQPAFLQQGSPGGFGGAFRGAMANMQGGPLGLIGGAIAGGMGMGQGNPQDVQRQNLRAQYQAFIGAGMSPQNAMLAVMNPEAAKTLVNETLTNKTEVKMVKDGFGQEHPYSWNPLTQEFKPLGAGSSSGGDAQGLTDKVAAMAQSGATRQQMLQQVPSDYRGHVEAVLDGRALPSNIGRGPARAAIMATAHAIDPTFDEANIPLRFKTAGDYAPNGQSGRSIVALNTVQHHIGKLSDDLENMGDTGWTVLNAIRNGVAVNTPLDPKQGTAVQAVQDDIKAVTDEMSAAYKAGKVSDHEIEAWNKLANSNLPARQLKQGIYDFVGLLNGKRDQLNETHQAILGRDAPGINKDLNETITKKVADRNSGTSSASAQQAGGNKPASVIQNGHTYTLQSDGSYK